MAENLQENLSFSGNTGIPAPKVQQWDNGLVLIYDFISEAEETAMINEFRCDGMEDNSNSSKKKRISRHFGFHFDYTTFGASETIFTPIPKYIENLLARLPIQKYLPDQFTVQYYPPGAGIPPHVDTHSMFEEALYSLSLGSTVPMLFRHNNKNDARRMRVPKRSLTSNVNSHSKKQLVEAPGHPPAEPELTQARPLEPEPDQDEESWEIFLPPRSLLLMTGPSRYGYVHGIRGRKKDQVKDEIIPREGRYSITMRTIRRGSDIRCECQYPGVCDARIREEMGLEEKRFIK